MAVAETIGAIGSVVSAGAAAASQIAKNKRSYKWTNKLNEEQQKRADAAATTAYERQRALIDEQRNYDSASSQMQRMKQAGLNPNLVYGDISSGQAAATAPQASSSPTSQFQLQDNWANISDNFVSMAQGIANLSQIESNVKNQDANTKLVESKTEGQDISNKYAPEQNESDIANKKANTELTKEQKEKVTKDTEKLTYEIEHLLPHQQAKIIEEVKKIKSECEQTQQLTPSMVAEYSARIKSLLANAHLSRRQAELLNKQIDWFDLKASNEIDLTHAQMDKLGQDTRLVRMENDLKGDIIEALYREFDKGLIKNNIGIPGGSNFKGHMLPNKWDLYDLFIQLKALGIFSKWP